MEKIRELLYPLSIKQFILANIGLGFVIVICFMPRAFNSFESFGIFAFWAFIICITQWFSTIYVNRLIDLKIKWLTQPVLRSILGIITLVLDSIIVFAIVQFIMIYAVYKLKPFDAWPYVSESIIYVLLISFIMSLIFTAIGFFKAWKLALIQSEKLKTEMMAFRYEALRNQINPHFLFNSFNVLSDLVYADQAMAVKFINQLSDLFRYVLDSRDKELVPLKDELAFMQSYIYLLKTRFEEKLDMKIEIDAAPDELIVPMTLQLLVENAVKHNEVSEAYPLQIHIRRNDTFLEVENSLRIKKVGEDSKNTGLKNIIQQFSYFTDRQIDVSNTDRKFLVRVPILKSSEK
jgi:two-component system LytT family sensor kinase